MRKATWAILIWTGLAGLMVWGIVSAAGRAAESAQSPAVNALAAGASIVVMLGIWWVGFLVLVLIWFMSRPQARVVIYGPHGEQAIVTEREAKRRLRRGWSYTPATPRPAEARVDGEI